MSAPSPDLFLVHAAPDRAAAEELFDLLAPNVGVWLDTRSLLVGDEWPVEIPRAQRAALATVILLSKNTEHAFYLRDEIHTAIALCRSAPGEHRAIVVFLDGRPDDPLQVPYGLRALHSLDAIAEGGLANIAHKLRKLVAVLRERGAPPATHPAPTEPAPVDPRMLYDQLCTLTLSGQLDSIILSAGLPRAYIRPEAASLAQRALDIVQLAMQGGPTMMARVNEAIARQAPWLRPRILTRRRV